MKTGSDKRMVKRDPRDNTPAGSVGQPERELAYEKPVKVADGKVKAGYVRMSVHRAFHLKSEVDGETYGAKEGDVVDVPSDVAEELEREFKTYFDHEGLINKKNAKQTVITRATRI